MKRLLFVTNRNIFTTSGELRLIKNRAEALYKQYGIYTDFIALASKKRIQSDKRESIEAGGDIKTLELDMTNPSIMLPLYKKTKAAIFEKLKNGEYSAVVLSGTAMALFTKGIKKKYNVRIYLDIHGALEDILEVSQKTSGFKARFLRILYSIDKFTIRKALLHIEGFFVVTEALKSYLIEKFAITDKKFFIVPCATSTNPIDEDEFKSDRKRYKEKYNILNGELVFVYSGGVSSWQCVEESVELYKALSEKLEVKTKMLIFSHNINEIKELAKGDERIQTDSYSPNELFHALRVGDFAFLLRKDNLTNNVAFPNKFLEYVQSGMHIITTPFIKEIEKQIREYDLGYIFNFDDDINMLLNYIKETNGINKDWTTINSVLIQNSFSATIKEFAEGFLNGN